MVSRRLFCRNGFRKVPHHRWTCLWMRDHMTLKTFLSLYYYCDFVLLLAQLNGQICIGCWCFLSVICPSSVSWSCLGHSVSCCKQSPVISVNNLFVTLALDWQHLSWHKSWKSDRTFYWESTIAGKLYIAVAVFLLCFDTSSKHHSHAVWIM